MNFKDKGRKLLAHEVTIGETFNKEVHPQFEKREPVSIASKDLRTHLFVPGDTGSGKTNTLFQLIYAQNFEGIPAMVFELAKKDFRALFDRKDMLNLPTLHFTPGIESINPFRFNFLELPPGVHVQTHIEMVVSAFTYAYAMDVPLPAILEEALIKTYEEKGWDIVHNIAPECSDKFPFPSELKLQIEKLFSDRTITTTYSGEIQNNLRAALVTRVNDVLQMGRGKMYNCKRGISFEDIYKQNVIFELTHFGDERRKKLFFGLFLGAFSNFIAAKGAQQRLRHVTIIDEAHRLLMKPRSLVGYNAVQIMVNLLAESRAHGEGIVIADQEPENLHPSIFKIARSCIVHSIDDPSTQEFICRHFAISKSYLSRIAAPGETVMLLPRITGPHHQPLLNVKTVKIQRFPTRPEPLTDKETWALMTQFRLQHQGVYSEANEADDIKDYEDLLLGLKNSKVDGLFAKIELNEINKSQSTERPLILRKQGYSLKPSERKIQDEKFTGNSVRSLIVNIENYLEGKNEANGHFWVEVWDLASKGLPEPPSLASISYFLRKFVERLELSRKSPWRAKAELYQQLIRKLIQQERHFFN